MMHRKIIGIFVCMLLIATAFPAVTSLDNINLSTNSLNNGISELEQTQQKETLRADNTLIQVLSSSLFFTENKGQYPDEVMFQTQLSGATVYLCSSKIVTVFHTPLEDTDRFQVNDDRFVDFQVGRTQKQSNRNVIVTSFVGSNPTVTLKGEEELSYYNNYFIGNNPSKWYTHVPNYRSVYYSGIYPGVDLRYYSANNSLKYDFIIHPEADSSVIQMRYSGVEHLEVLEEGDLEVIAKGVGFVEKKPVIYQDINGIKHEINGEFSIDKTGLLTFQLNAEYDARYALIIDPGLVYSTYLGGGDDDDGFNIAVDASGCAYITGSTKSMDFPTYNAYDNSYNSGYSDVFITKFSSSGDALIYSTYLGGGGANADIGKSIVVDASGCVYIIGTTGSSDFPTYNAYDSSYNGGLYDVFVTKLSSSGDALLYSTFLGGTVFENGNDIAVDASGCAYITGTTGSSDFPTYNAYDNSLVGYDDAFLTKLSSSGDTLVYSTFLGGEDADVGNGIVVDASGCVYITGTTGSSDFPTYNAYDSSFNGWLDVFVTKFSSSGDALVYSTYLGDYVDDFGNDIVIDASGCAYITGFTYSPNFPTHNANDSTYNGEGDVFVTKLLSSGDALVYSTYLGGEHQDSGVAIVVDASGCAYIIGTTGSSDFPIYHAYDGSYNGGPDDVFITKFSSSGDTFIFSTYLGGTDHDSGRGIAIDASNYVYLTGSTNSSDFPEKNAYDDSYNGNNDIFIAKIDIKIGLTLFIEDSIQPDSGVPVVNKARGDFIDVVTIVKNIEEYEQDIRLFVAHNEMTSSLLIQKCFSRTSFSDMDESNVITWEHFLTLWWTDIHLDPGVSKQIVWRFYISEAASLNPSFPVYSYVYVDSELCSSSQACFSLVNTVKSIIVTNRYLLFENYDAAQVKSLLNYLYEISSPSRENCVLYYVDRYNDSSSEDIMHWDQDVDYTSETTANIIANEIDVLIEQWAENLAITRFFPLFGELVLLKKYPYLMIIGGDEIIPYYRAVDPTPEDNECDHPYGIDDPVLSTMDNCSFITDDIYADTDDTRMDEGKLEMVTGRIVGYCANDMENFIKNGLAGPANNNNVVVASMNEWDYEEDYWRYSDLDWAIEELKKKKTLVNESILNDNDEWGSDELTDALKQGFSIFVYLSHGNYYYYSPPHSYITGYQLLTEINENNCVTNNRPFIANLGCRQGIVTNGLYYTNPVWYCCLMYAWVHHNISGAFGAGGLSYYRTGEDKAGYGEQFGNDFFEELKIKSGSETIPVGNAFIATKRNYVPNGDGSVFNEYDRKTMLEYILYGIPWMTIDPENTGDPLSEFDSQVEIEISDPTLLPDGNYSTILEINVTGYNVVSSEGFEIITINGTEQLGDILKPEIPTATVELLLPKNTNITDLTLIDGFSYSIGDFNIPCSNIIPNTYAIGYTDETDVVGFYPDSIYSMDITDCEDHLQVRLYISLIQHNPQTNQTILQNYTKLEFLYQTPVPILITDTLLDKGEYSSGDTINASLLVRNIGSETLTNLYVNLSLKDNYDETKAFVVSSPFDIQNGYTETIHVELDQNLPTGTYILEANITGSDTLAFASQFVHISSGEIIGFNHPDTVYQGNNMEFEILFKNHKQTSVETTGSISLYDSDGIQVAVLPSLPIIVGPYATTSINLLWNTVGKELGDYTAAAMVIIDDESIGPVSSTFSIIPSDMEPPITIKTVGNPKFGENDEWVTSSTEFNLTATDDLSGVDTTLYRIWWNGFWTPWVDYAGNFSLSNEGKHYLQYFSTDILGNVENVQNQTHYVDDTAASITVEIPYPEEALQDGVTFRSLVTDSCGVKWVKYSIREPGGTQGIVIDSMYEALNAFSTTDDKWDLLFDTLQLPDGYYVLFVNASDHLGNVGYTTQNFSIRNWAVLEMLPNTPNSIAGRTIPVKFSLRVAEAVDPSEPFVRNEELTIKIYVEDKPWIILQISTYGPKSRDYRINSTEEKYITNFKTLRIPKTYVVEILRNTFLIGSFKFQTVNHPFLDLLS